MYGFAVSHGGVFLVVADDPGQEIIIDSPPRVGSNTTSLTTYPGGFTSGAGGSHGGVKHQQNWPFTLPKAQCKFTLVSCLGSLIMYLMLVSNIV